MGGLKCIITHNETCYRYLLHFLRKYNLKEKIVFMFQFRILLGRVTKLDFFYSHYTIEVYYLAIFLFYVI